MKHIYFSYIVSVATVMAMLISCQENEAIVHMDALADTLSLQELCEIKIPESQVPLFANLSDYDVIGKDNTRADGDELKSLFSLLDMEDIREGIIDGRRWRQTAFVQNKENIFALTDSNLEDFSKATILRKYLIETEDEDGVILEPYVVTMIIGSDFYHHRDKSSFDFLNKTNFDGVILFSDIEGELFDVRVYRNGMIYQGKAVKRDDNTGLNGDCVYVSLIENVSGNDTKMTRTMDETLDPAICIATRTIKIEVMETQFINVTMNDVGGGSAGKFETIMKVGARGGSPSAKLEPMYRVTLSVDNPDLGKITSGNGSYVSGTTVAILTEPTNILHGTQFDHWRGMLKGHGPSLICKVSQNINDVACWGERPCADSIRNLANPLLKMSIASPNTWGNYWTGTYGTDIRGYRIDEDGVPQPIGHFGIDLAADPGTKVYAMADGVINRIVDNAPNTNVNNSFGNIIEYTSYINGRQVMFRYAHLQYGNPVAVNPSSKNGDKYKVQDIVKMGDVIGYTGRTGNAWNVKNKHLHLEVYVDGIRVDPRNWINATYGSTQSALNAAKGAMTINLCDNKK